MTANSSPSNGAANPPDSANAAGTGIDAAAVPATAAQVMVNSTGSLLKTARESQGLSVNDIANRLRMGAKQVLALESGDYAALPTGTFLRGFVRNYAKTLNIAPEEVLIHLEKDHASARPMSATPVVVPMQQNIKVPLPGGELATPKARIAIAGLVVCLLCGAVWYWWTYVRPHRADGGRAPVPVAAPAVTESAVAVPVRPPEVAPPLGPALEPGTTAVSEAAKAADAVAPSPSASAPSAAPAVLPEKPTTTATPTNNPAARPAPAPVLALPKAATPGTAVPAPASASSTSSASLASRSVGGPGVIGFTFSGESWVEVIDGSGKTILSKRYRAGDAEELVGKPPFSVVIGNAQATRMAVNGREFDLVPHTRGSVARVPVK